MKVPIKPRQIPPRLGAGAFILDSGLNKRSADEATVKKLHDAAVTAYPFLANIEPDRFVSTLSKVEIALGLALVTPLVPTRIAALGLLGFSSGLVGLYLRTPGTTRDESVAPTPQGIPLAKDSWLLAIAVGLLIDTIDD